MKLLEKPRRHLLLLTCLIGIAYLAVSLAYVEQYISVVATDSLKLGLIVALCVVGFLLGHKHFRSTNTTPIFLAAMILLVVLHVMELAEEFTSLQSVPLFDKTTLSRRAFDVIALIGIVALLLIGNFLSISEINRARRQAESNLQRLQERERRYRALFEAANDAIFIMKGEICVQCNSRALEMFGCTKDQIVGQTPYRFSPPTQPDGQDSREKALQKLAKAQAGEPQSFQWQHIRYDGTSFDVEISLNSVELSDGPHIQAVVRDVTERKQAEQALRESESKLREAQQMAQLGHWFWDVETGDVEWSDEVYKIFRLSPDTFTPQIDSIMALSPWPEEHQRHKELMCRAMESRQPGAFEQRFLRPDGSTGYYYSTFQGVYDSDGDLKAMKGTVQDITERKRAEEDLLAHQRRLRSLASELSLAEERERRRIAAGLHDEACQTLVLSKMKLQELPEPLPPRDAAEIARICGTLDGTLQSIRELVFDLSSPTLYKFGLEAALEELLEDRLRARHGIRCAFHNDQAPKPLAEDVRILLFQSVRELFVNIIKYAQAQNVTVDVARSGDTIKITVADDGAGFDATDILSTPSRSRGFGLFHIAERLDYIGGALDIDSCPGKGSRFTLTAPLEPQQRAPGMSIDSQQRLP